MQNINKILIFFLKNLDESFLVRKFNDLILKILLNLNKSHILYVFKILIFSYNFLRKCFFFEENQSDSFDQSDSLIFF